MQAIFLRQLGEEECGHDWPSRRGPPPGSSRGPDLSLGLSCLPDRQNVLVKLGMAANTKRYEIILLVATEEASRLNVVYLKVFQTATMLAAPAVAGQDLFPQAPV